MNSFIIHTLRNRSSLFKTEGQVQGQGQTQGHGSSKRQTGLRNVTLSHV